MNCELLKRAARAVKAATDDGASHYDAQSPVEDWALDALDSALLELDERAARLLNKYETAAWDASCNAPPPYRINYPDDEDNAT